MEATALSLGKAVLDGALGYAMSFLEDEIYLQLGVEGDVDFITGELEMMKAFLMTADEEQDKHPVLLTWVKQVREVSYNVEDRLMDFSAHSDKRPTCWWCIPRTLWERRDIAKEMKELRVMVEDVSNRNLRYRLIKGSGSKSTTAAEEVASIATAAMSGINEAMRTAMAQESSVVDLGHLITNEDKDCTVIAICGAPGDVRKTTAIQDVYDDLAVRAIFGFRAWVKLVHPFNPRDFIRSLVRQYYENFPELVEEPHKRKTTGISVFMKMDSMTESEMFDLVDKKMSGNRYLVVVDDLSTKEDWDCIKHYFPDNKNGSRVIVSTQHQEIASLCVEKRHQVSRLKQFSSDRYLCLFHTKVMPLSSDLTSDDVAVSNSEIQEDKDGDREVSESTARKKLERSRTMAPVDELLGRTTEKSKLIELVQDKQAFRVISVWGMGGQGKTSLVQSVCRSPLLADWKRAWATALRPFNPEQVIRRIALDLVGEETVDQETKESKKIKDLIDKLTLQYLTDKLTTFFKKEENEKCLVVLDDISCTKEWDLVKHCLKDARRIIVTTREKGIAKHCSGAEDKNMYNLSGLNDDIALDLFKKKVFKDGVDMFELTPPMVELARLILEKCDGLPLAISTIGGFLATKPKTATEWRKTYNRISAELHLNPELATIKTVLVRSYDGLPYHLKSCFLYLSIFPEDHKIMRKPIVRRWVAEGYAREMQGMTAEEVGDNYFEELLDRSMILPGEKVNIRSGKVDSCQLHDIMRQICIWKAREENLSFTLEDGCCLSSTQGAVRHLAILSSNGKEDKDMFERALDLSHVRSFTVFGKWRSYFISKKTRFLLVLDLEGADGLEDHHLSHIGDLIHLKYLSLRRCSGIINLPSSLGRLRNLRTLDIRDTWVFRLPPSVTNLRKLQFVRAYRLYNVPRGIENLRALCRLGNLQLYGEGKPTLKELAQLCQLRKLEIQGITETNNKEFWSAIASLNHLQSLSVNMHSSWCDKLDSSLGGSLLPPRSIESLKLGSQLVTLAEWIHQLQNLSKLQLYCTTLQQRAIEAVGKQPNLVILSMRGQSFNGEELIFKQGSFPSLVLLELQWIEGVPVVRFEDGTMPKLELLRIDGWRELRELRRLKSLPKLKEIKLENLGGCEEFTDDIPEQLAEHSNNVIVTRS